MTNVRPARRATKRLGLGMIAVAATCSLTSCAVSASADPVEVYKHYIADLNDGDYDAALQRVADPAGVTADQITNHADHEFSEPLLRGEGLVDGAESGVISFDLDGEVQAVEFVLRDGDWLLRQPMALVPYDFADDMEALSAFEAVGSLSMTAQNGDPVEPARGFAAMSEAAFSSQEFVLTLTSQIIPTQSVSVVPGQISSAWASEGLDLGDIEALLAPVAEELQYVDYHYDVDDGQYVTQYGPVEIESCPPHGNISDGLFTISCSVSHPVEDWDGNEFLMSEFGEGVESESKFDNLSSDYSRYALAGCYYNTGGPSANVDYTETLDLSLTEDTATVLWFDYDAENVFSFVPMIDVSESDVESECSGWDPARVGDVKVGLAPRSSTATGTEVQISF